MAKAVKLVFYCVGPGIFLCLLGEGFPKACRTEIPPLLNSEEEESLSYRPWEIPLLGGTGKYQALHNRTLI